MRDLSQLGVVGRKHATSKSLSHVLRTFPHSHIQPLRVKTPDPTFFGISCCPGTESGMLHKVMRGLFYYSENFDWLDSSEIHESGVDM